jgi:hypothetical protein
MPLNPDWRTSTVVALARGALEAAARGAGE